MKEETRILELLAEVLQNQDKANREMTEVKQLLNQVDVRLSQVEENQRAHQQILRTMATNQQNNQKPLEGIFDLLDTVTRMQRDQNRRLDRLENPDMA